MMKSHEQFQYIILKKAYITRKNTETDRRMDNLTDEMKTYLSYDIV